ncbi:MAG: hypothetical protein NT062_34135 [Proteobacteria bacterium]|nr:hypothetical protein [Pseudomonadota bacterium]
MRMIMVALGALVGAAIPHLAFADRTGPEVRKEAEKLKKAGKLQAACDAFAEADKLAPDPPTKLALANCYAELGKLGSAWHLYRALGKTDQADKVAKKAPKLAIEITPKVTRGVRIFAGTLDLSAAIETPIPVDQGDVELAATAPGFQVWRQKVAIADGETTTIAITLAKQTAVAKIDPNDPDAPEPEKDEDVVPQVVRYAPFVHEVVVGGELGFLFAPQAYRARARLAYSHKSIVEAAALVGARGNFDRYDFEFGGGVDLRLTLPYGNFCRVFGHGEASYWSRAGVALDVGGGVTCRDWRSGKGPQLFVAADKELGDGPGIAVVVGLGTALLDKR